MNLRKLGQISSPFCTSVRRYDKEVSNVNGIIQSRPQSEFVTLPLLWNTRGRSTI